MLYVEKGVNEMSKRYHFISLILVVILSLLLSACGDEKGNNTESENNNETSQDEVKLGETSVTMVGDSYGSAIALNNTAKAVLENLGYDVTLKHLGVGTMFAGVVEGSADIALNVWLPHTHGSYWKKYKDQLKKVGVIVEEVPLGLTVPKYMEIDSIKDLKGNKELGKKLDWTITGISPGAGEMIVTKKKVMPSYGLKDKWELMSSSGPAMTAALGKAIEDKEPIVVTLWSPHWAFLRWDLKYLEDPKNKYGDPDDIFAVVHPGLKEKSPVAYQFLEQFKIKKESMNKIMMMIENGMDPDKAAKKWLGNHSDIVDKWTKGLKSAK